MKCSIQWCALIIVFPIFLKGRPNNQSRQSQFPFRVQPQPSMIARAYWYPTYCPTVASPLDSWNRAEGYIVILGGLAGPYLSGSEQFRGDCTCWLDLYANVGGSPYRYMESTLESRRTHILDILGILPSICGGVAILTIVTGSYRIITLCMEICTPYSHELGK